MCYQYIYTRPKEHLNAIFKEFDFRKLQQIEKPKYILSLFILQDILMISMDHR